MPFVVSYLVLLEETEATALERLRTLPVGAPLNCISQRRHFGDVSVLILVSERATNCFGCEDVAGI
jgi:hypothetical protein